MRKIVLFDGFMMWVIVYQVLQSTEKWNLTIFQSLVIGFFACTLFMMLFQIKYIGRVMEFLGAVVWTYLTMIFVPFGKWTNNSKPWLVGITIVLFLLYFGFHSSKMKESEEEQERTSRGENYNL